MRRIDIQHFPCLFRREVGILFQESPRMRNGHVDRPKGL
jgi:hypothetical protein